MERVSSRTVNLCSEKDSFFVESFRKLKKVKQHRWTRRLISTLNGSKEKMVGNAIFAKRDDAETDYFFIPKILYFIFSCTSDVIS